MTEQLVKISELAKLLKINPHTIRHYEDKELLFPAEVSENGYRKYGLAEAYQLSFILFLKELGVSLSEIKVLLENGTPTDYEQVLRLKKQALLAEQKRLETLSQLVDEQLGLTQQSKEQVYSVSQPVRLKKLVRKPLDESFELADLLKMDLADGLMTRLYYIIHDEFYDICCEDSLGQDFVLAAGEYDVTLIEGLDDAQLTLALEKFVLQEGFPIVAIEDSDRFFTAGDTIALKVLGDNK